MKLDYDRIDPQLRGALEVVPKFEITRENIVELRSSLADLGPPAAQPAKVIEAKETIATKDGEVDIYVYRKNDRAGQPALLWIHGGGYILGSAEDETAQRIAELCDCTVLSVEYRLAPEHPFPAGPNDCYAALSWLMSDAHSYDTNPRRVAIGGASAGGGMAAGVALMNRDRDRYPICLQLLLYPMIDNLHETDSGKITNHPVWNLATSLNAWEMYLDGTPGRDASPYAAASRADDLRDLPPAYVCVGSEDLFLDENIDYARRLSAAGVPTELAVFPGLYHGGDAFVAQASVSARLRRSFLNALDDALNVGTAS